MATNYALGGLSQPVDPQKAQQKPMGMQRPMGMMGRPMGGSMSPFQGNKMPLRQALGMRSPSPGFGPMSGGGAMGGAMQRNPGMGMRQVPFGGGPQLGGPMPPPSSAPQGLGRGQAGPIGISQPMSPPSNADEGGVMSPPIVAGGSKVDNSQGGPAGPPTVGGPMPPSAPPGGPFYGYPSLAAWQLATFGQQF
jgi:hypothetical protein